jgi:hypothetical protein
MTLLPKGERVRATFGENVLVGILQMPYSGYETAYIDIEGDDRPRGLSTAWAIQRIEPPYKDPELHRGMLVRELGAIGSVLPTWIFLPGPNPFRRVWGTTPISDLRADLPKKIERGYIGTHGEFVPLDKP